MRTVAAAKRERREKAAARAARSGGPAAKAGEEGVGGDRLDHDPRLRSVDGGGAEGHVLEGLDEDAAEPEHADWAEDWVTLHTEDGLDASRHHGGDEAAVDHRVRLGRAGGGEDLVEGGLGGGAVGDAEADAPDDALVEDVLREHLEDDGKAEVCRRVRRFAGGLGVAGGHGRYAGCGGDVQGG